MKVAGIIPHYTMMPRSSRDYYRSLEMHIPNTTNTFDDDDIHEGERAHQEGEDVGEVPIETGEMDDDISQTDALANFMAAFYSPHEGNIDFENETVDAINPEWVQMKKDGETPLFEGAKLSR